MPMQSDEQVCVIYAGVRGYLDDVITKEIGRFEELFLTYMRGSHQDLMDEIRRTGVLTADQDKKMGEILTEWLPTSGLEMRAK